MRSRTRVSAILCLAVSACNDGPTATTDLHSGFEISAPQAQANIDDAPTVIIPGFVCAVILGGTVTVPGGSHVVVVQRWGAKTRGLVQEFLNAQTTTLVVNDGAPMDVSDRYDPIAQSPSGGYFTRVLQPTGVTVGIGETMTFSIVMELAHQLHDGFTFEDADNHRKLFFGPGVAFEFPCTVVGI